MRLILLGSPGCGKGTQSTRLQKHLGIPQISTGDIFRANIRECTPIGIKVKEIVDNGGLVSDDITLQLVRDRLSKNDCANGYILDGFPRSLPQAEAFDKIATVDYVINFVIDQDTIIHRLTGRRVCTKCGKIHHIDTLQTDKCDVCNGELFIRADDSIDSVHKRLTAYGITTQPLIGYYRRSGKLIDVDANQQAEEVFAQIIKAIE
ncbi:MAG: adenylate kinase [Clostridia bacterium]|nr:adenylate kinase [Clostridia bacterium]